MEQKLVYPTRGIKANVNKANVQALSHQKRATGKTPCDGTWEGGMSLGLPDKDVV